MKRLRAGVIGLGVGEEHIAGYQSHPDCAVVALCDFSDEKLRTVGAKYPGIRLSSQAGEVLQDPEIDVVSIASYDNYHYEQIVQAINYDKHIFVEKPLCLYENEAAHIRALLEQKPSLKMSSNLILRMSPRFRLLKQMITNGEMGQLFYVEGDYNYGRFYKITDGWRGKIDYYSAVCGGGVHMVDLLLWLTRDRVVEVAAYGKAGSTFPHDKSGEVLLTPTRAGPGVDHRDVGYRSIRDEHLRTIENPRIALPLGPCPQGGHIRARARLRKAHTSDPLPAGQPGNVLPLLRIRTVREDRVRTEVRMRAVAQGESAIHSGLTKRLRCQHRCHHIRAATPEFFGKMKTQDAKFP